SDNFASCRSKVVETHFRPVPHVAGVRAVSLIIGFPLAGPSHARRLALMSRPDSRTDCAEGRPVARPPKTS
ncbi:hypothetical protein, partial [Nocardia cyriacigeorgica]|uniref:hypothetical protein n=1 Tax=Nocardia cyriacigeorgica TaxID=135487 RepID=UPI0024581497